MQTLLLTLHISVVILYDYQKRDGASLASLVYSSTEINSSDDDSVFFLLLHQYSILSFVRSLFCFFSRERGHELLNKLSGAVVSIIFIILYKQDFVRLVFFMYLHSLDCQYFSKYMFWNLSVQ